MAFPSKNPYSEFYTRQEVVVKYAKKFDTKIDGLRHRVEARVLKQYAQGDLFDCSLGTGRFIPELGNKLKSYSGMDYSPAFLSYLKEHYPEVKTWRADLEKEIPQPSEKYDTVICIRTLYALRNTDKIIKEMKRIAKKDGLIIFDYTTREKYDGKLGMTIGTAKIPELTQANNLKVKKIIPLDGFFQMVKKYKQAWLKPAFNSKYNLVPKRIYLALEKISTLFYKARQLYILQK